MKRFKNILFVPGNRTDETSPSLRRAIALAINNQAELTLLKVLPELSSTSYSKVVGISVQQIKEKVQVHEETRLNQLLSSLQPDFGIRTELKIGKMYVEVIRAAQSEGFDLVIKEADCIEWLSRFFGSDDMHLLRKCPCPVWLMKEEEKADYRNIMAAVDFGADEDTANSDALNQTIMDLACSLSLPDQATVHAVNVYDVPESGFISLWVDDPDNVEQELAEAERRHRQASMHALLADLQARVGQDTYNYLSLRSHVVPGIPGRDLPRIADTVEADLLVMGTVARTGIAGVIVGNTAEVILSQLNCSVLAIKPKGFESPIF